MEIFERELFEGSLALGRRVLEGLGYDRAEARELALKFRRHNIDAIDRFYPHYTDQTKLVARLARRGSWKRCSGGTGSSAGSANGSGTEARRRGAACRQRPACVLPALIARRTSSPPSAAGPRPLPWPAGRRPAVR